MIALSVGGWCIFLNFRYDTSSREVADHVTRKESGAPDLNENQLPSEEDFESETDDDVIEQLQMEIAQLKLQLQQKDLEIKAKDMVWKFSKKNLTILSNFFNIEIGEVFFWNSKMKTV